VFSRVEHPEKMFPVTRPIHQLKPDSLPATKPEILDSQASNLVLLRKLSGCTRQSTDVAVFEDRAIKSVKAL
jgi:hypothetical protein